MLSGRIFLLLKQIILPFLSFSKLHFSQVSQKKIAFYYIRNIPAALEGLYFSGLIICFILFPLYSLIWFLEFWDSIYYTSNTFYYFLYFREIAFASLHIYYLKVFVLTTYLQCYIFIVFYLPQILRRTILLRFNNMFFHITFVSDTWEERYYFALTLCFFLFHLSQISEKNYVTSP